MPFGQESPLAVERLEEVKNTKDEEGSGTADSDNFETDSAGDGPTANDSNTSADGMATASTKSNPPVILSGSHGDGSNLASVTPLAQEGHDKGLNPGRAKQQRAEVGYSLEDARRTTTGFPNRGLRR